MLKKIVFLKRTPGMSFDAFVDYYESRHAPLGLQAMPLARKYTRRYIRAEASSDGTQNTPPFDVITEVWFDDAEAYAQTIAGISEEQAAEIDDDEKKLFDPAFTWFVVVEERESAIP
ncbi:MAG: EthD domain-containing protein [Sphingomonadaceae bacterium]